MATKTKPFDAAAKILTNNQGLVEALLYRSNEIIRDNSRRINQLKAEATALGMTYEDLKKATDSGHKSLYEEWSSLKAQSKQTKRKIGELLVTTKNASEDFLVQRAEELLADKSGNSAARLVAAMKQQETAFVNYTKGRGTVGHHPTATNILRDILGIDPENFVDDPRRIPLDITTELLEIANAKGYKIDPTVYAYLDPTAHGKQAKNIRGLLQKKGIGHEAQELILALWEGSAHSRVFGDYAGVNIAKELVPEGMSASEMWKVVQPHLELSKAGTIEGINMHKILTEGKYNNARELFQLIEKAGLPNTDLLLNDVAKLYTDKGLKVPPKLINAYTDPSNLPKEFQGRWKPSAGGSILTKSRRILEPGAAGATDIEGFLRKGGQFNAFSMGADGAAAIPWQQQGLFSGVINDVMNAAGNVSGQLDNLGSKALNKAAIWNLTTQGGMKPLQNFAAKEFLPGTVLGTVFDENQRNRLGTALFSNEDLQTRFTAGTQFANQAIRDEAIGQAVWHGVARPLNYAWGLLPGAVQSVITKGSAIGLVSSIGGSTPQGSQRWRSLGYKSESEYIEKMRTYMNTSTNFNPEKNYYDRDLVNMITDYDKRNKPKEKVNEEENNY